MPFRVLWYPKSYEGRITSEREEIVCSEKGSDRDFQYEKSWAHLDETTEQEGSKHKPRGGRKQMEENLKGIHPHLPIGESGQLLDGIDQGVSVFFFLLFF